MQSLSTLLSRHIVSFALFILMFSIAFMMITTAAENMEKNRAEVDARRVAGVLEIVDQKPNTFAQMRFDGPYDKISFSGDTLVMNRGKAKTEIAYNVASDLPDASLSKVTQLCIMNNGESLYVAKACDNPSTILEQGTQRDPAVESIGKQIVTTGGT